MNSRWMLDLSLIDKSSIEHFHYLEDSDRFLKQNTQNISRKRGIRQCTLKLRACIHQRSEKAGHKVEEHIHNMINKKPVFTRTGRPGMQQFMGSQRVRHD